MAGKTAVLSVRILTDAKAGKAGLQDYGSGVERLQGRLDKVTPAATVALGGVLALAKGAGDAASELQQSTGAVESVFGSMADTVDRQSRRAADSVGLAATEYNNLAAVLGSQLKNAGTPLDDLAGKTDGLIQLGSDLAATYGGSTQEAVSAISSLLRGESDPIERFGVSMNANAIAAEKLRLGLGGLSGEADKAAQQQAILSLLTNQTADAQGQFARESDTAAGAQARATAEWANATAELGTALLPAMGFLATMLGDLAGLLTEHQTLVLIVGGVIGGLALAVLGLNAGLRAYQAAQVAVTAAQWLWNAAMTANPIGLIIVGIAALIAIIVLVATHWDEVRAGFQIGVDLIVDAMVWLGNRVSGIVGGIIGWFQDAIGWAVDLANKIGGFLGGGGMMRAFTGGTLRSESSSTMRTFSRMSTFAASSPSLSPTYASPVKPASGGSGDGSVARVVNNYTTNVQAGVADKHGVARAVQNAVRADDKATGTTRASGRPRW